MNLKLRQPGYFSFLVKPTIFFFTVYSYYVFTRGRAKLLETPLFLDCKDKVYQFYNTTTKVTSTYLN